MHTVVSFRHILYKLDLVNKSKLKVNIYYINTIGKGQKKNSDSNVETKYSHITTRTVIAYFQKQLIMMKLTHI